MSFVILSYKKDHFLIFTDEQRASVKFALLFVVLRIFSLAVEFTCTTITTFVSDSTE